MKITLCGSARFEREFQEWNERLSLAGHVVYGLAVLPSFHEGNKDWYTEDQKRMLDLVHIAKIEESDAIFILNVGGYIGDSTRREIEWASLRGKMLFYVTADDEGTIEMKICRIR